MKRMMILLTILLAGMVGNTYAQGIRFWKGSFEEATREAKRQDKLIFIDFYTVWCGLAKACPMVSFHGKTWVNILMKCLFAAS